VDGQRNRSRPAVRGRVFSCPWPVRVPGIPRQPSFAACAFAILANARALAEDLLRRGVRLVTGGTGNHIVLMDVAASFG
jgi:Serine hydroxymethyltransferase